MSKIKMGRVMPIGTSTSPVLLIFPTTEKISVAFALFRADCIDTTIGALSG
jgi:hypothetical protein